MQVLSRQTFTNYLKQHNKKIKIIFTDIDGTLTGVSEHNGKLLNHSYNALWQLYEKGYIIIPITGRPAGWCDMILRQWPVHGVIGENGAFFLYKHKNANHSFKYHYHSALKDNKAFKAKLEVLTKKVLATFPNTTLASDQNYRLFDSAFDFAESINHDQSHAYKMKLANQIKNFCENQGATVKISDIHVNVWFCQYDKLSMLKQSIKLIRGLSEDIQDVLSEGLYCGDSPNDEPFFKGYPLSIGVKNLEPFLEQLNDKPDFITQKEGGEGFKELADILLAYY